MASSKKISRKKFTLEEDKYILEHYQECTCQEIADYLGRNKTSILVHGKNSLGIKQFKPAIETYTPEQDEWLIKNIPKYMYRDLVPMFEEKFGRKITKKQIKYRNEYKYHIITGREGWGNGMKPINYEPIGYEMTTSDGYTFVKVADTGVKSVDFRPKSQVKYIEYHGSIPENHIVIFLDGDRTNFNEDNLVAVDNRVNGSMNHDKIRSVNDRDLTLAAIRTWQLYYAVKDAKHNN